jgi:hypothetical protein
MIVAVARRQRRWDCAGMLAAAICAVHCLIMPWLIAAAPLIGAALLPESTEAVLLTASLGISSYAMTSGSVGTRRRWPPILLLACGAATLLAVRAIGEDESALERLCVVCGAGCLVWGHALNVRSSRRTATGIDVPVPMYKE